MGTGFKKRRKKTKPVKVLFRKHFVLLLVQNGQFAVTIIDWGFLREDLKNAQSVK